MAEPIIPDLGAYTVGDFSRGRPKLIEMLWLAVQAALISSWIPGSAHRRLILRAFGAKIGRGVTLKPGIRIKFPWRLTIGENSWIGEESWIDNLAEVHIGRDVNISQSVYLCTGSHDWSAPGFDLITRAITIEAGAWVGARAVVGPGVTIGRGAVLGLGSVATRDLTPWTIYLGVPAEQRSTRRIDAASAEREEGCPTG